MTSSGVLIIGSGPAGISAAESYRDAGGTSAAAIVTAGTSTPPFCPPSNKDVLPGTSDAAAIGLRPAQWFSDRALEFVRDDTVVSVDVHMQCATALTGRRIEYSHLILACGADAKPLSAPGSGYALSVRSASSVEIHRGAAAEADTAVVIGAGFPGCEAAASLAMKGIATTLVAPDDVPEQKRLGRAAGERIAALLDGAGVNFVGGVKVSSIEPGAVHLDNGVTVDADLILASTGKTPRVELAAQAGIRIAAGRVVADDRMRTSVANIYAAGDVALARNRIAGRHVAVEYRQDVITHGRIAGANAAGRSSSWHEVPGFWTTIGDRTLKYTAWGDGYGRARLVERGDGFAVWYETNGIAVGVLTSGADDDYTEAQTRIRSRGSIPL